jgi:hypothetical protein
VARGLQRARREAVLLEDTEQAVVRPADDDLPDGEVPRQAVRHHQVVARQKGLLSGCLCDAEAQAAADGILVGRGVIVEEVAGPGGKEGVACLDLVAELPFVGSELL